MWKLVIMAGVATGALWAAADPSGAPGGYIGVGVISSVLTGLGVILSGKIVVPTFAYNREKDRADKWEAAYMDATKAIQDRHVPALDAATHAVTESTVLMTRALEALARRRNT